MSVRLLKIGIPTFLILYALIGYYSQFSKEGEVYPFFSWQLFTRTPNLIETFYSIRITEANGKKIDSPQPYLPNDAILSSQIQPTEYWILFQFLGRAHQSNDEVGINKYSSLLNKSFTSRHVRYELVSVTRDNIDYWKNHRYIDIKLLATYYAD